MTGLIGLMVVVNMCPVLGSAFYQCTGLDEIRSIFDATVSMRVLNNITEKESVKATSVLHQKRAHFNVASPIHPSIHPFIFLQLAEY